MKNPHSCRYKRKEGRFRARCKQCGYIGQYPNRPSRCTYCQGKVEVLHRHNYHSF